MTHDMATLITGLEWTPAAYRRGLYRARLVIGQLRDQAMASRGPSRSRIWAWTPPPSMHSGMGWTVSTTTSGKRKVSAGTWSPGKKRCRQEPNAPGGSSGGPDSRPGCLGGA